MKSASTLVISLIVLIGIGCGTSLQERADEQLQRGNYEAAAANYRTALEDDPDNRELRSKYRNAADLAVRANIEEARHAASEGAWEDAIHSTNTALEWGPQRNDATIWATGFDSRLADEVHRRAVANDFDGAVELADLAADVLPTQFSADTRTERDKALGTWKGWLLSEAASARKAGALATSAVYLAEAAAVTGEPALERDAAAAIQSIRAQHRVTFSVYPGRERGSSALVHVPDEIGSAAVVKGRFSAAYSSVEVDVRDVRVIDDTITETQSKRYVTGHENRKSREWVAINRDIRRLEERLAAARVRESRARRAVEANRSARTEAQHAAAKDEVKLFEQRVKERERDLFFADEWVREEVYAVHYWDVRTVTRTGLAVAHLTWTDPVTGQRRKLEEPVRIAETDTAQRGFRDADIADDPLRLPSVAEMERSVAAEVGAHVTSLLEQQYEAVLSAAMEEAAAKYGATEGAALGVILRPENPPAAAGRDLVRLTGVRSSIASTVGAI